MGLQRAKLEHQGIDGGCSGLRGRRQHRVDVRRKNVGEDDEAPIDGCNFATRGLQVRAQSPDLVAGSSESALTVFLKRYI